MLANNVALCRELLSKTPAGARDRFQREHALRSALETLTAYITCPDPDRDKDIRRAKLAMKNAALAGQNNDLWTLQQKLA